MAVAVREDGILCPAGKLRAPVGCVFWLRRRDVLPEKRTEIVRTQDDDRVEPILDTMREGVLILDEACTIRHANPAASRMLAIPVDRLLGSQPAFAVPDAGNAEVALPGGTLLDVQSTVITWRGGPARLIALQDVTATRKLAAELRQCEALYQREREARVDTERQGALLHDLMTESPTMMCVLQGPEHVFLYANDLYCKAIGHTAADILGKRCHDVVPELAATNLFEVLDQVYATGELFRASEMLVPLDMHRDGKPQEGYFTFTYQAMRDAEGRVTGVVFNGVDVTEGVLARRALEQTSAEIAQLNRDLERRVADRTMELMAANRELEAFAYSVSHDLRAPLRRIDGYSRALLEDFRHKLDDTGWHYLSRIRVAAQHMGEIIDDLLALAQVARQDLEISEVSLSEMARTILDELQEHAPDRQVEVCIAPAMTVRGDVRLLRLALENLLENAWKFTSKRDQTVIEIGVDPGDGAPEGETVFFVRDNGAGFDPAFTAKLFSTFNRLHSPVEFPGTGIGLATVKRVLDRHGGRVWAEGVVDGGAVFYFTVPSPDPAPIS